MGTEVTISFLLTCGVLAGYEAMKASGWRIWGFGIVAASFIAAGLGWVWLKEISPPVTAWVTKTAESPQSWFLLFVLGLVLLSVTGRNRKGDAGGGLPDFETEIKEIRQNIGSINAKLGAIQNYDDNDLRRLINDVMQKQASLEAHFKQSAPASEVVRQLKRTAFLLATDAVQKAYEVRLKKLKEIIPLDTALVPGAVITDEYLLTQSARIDGFLTKLTNVLNGSRWINGLTYLLADAERRADHELKNTGSPEGVNPYAYREFHISCMKRDALAEYLDRSINETQLEEAQMLQMLREQADVHK